MKLSTRELATIAVFGTTASFNTKDVLTALQRRGAWGHRPDHRSGGKGIRSEKGFYFVRRGDCHAAQIIQPGWCHHWSHGRDFHRGAGS